jgi:ABC-type lipoprotein release transport system permease subunit
MWILKLALRNLARNKRRSLITITAIAAGMGMMNFTICMQHGTYEDLIGRGVGSMSGHVVVQAEGYQEAREPETMVPDSSSVMTTLEEAFPEARVLRRSFLGGLITSTSGSSAIGVNALEPDKTPEDHVIRSALIEGAWLASDRDILIGARLASTLDADLGDKLVFMTQVEDEMTSRLFRVKGIFQTGSSSQDGFLALMTLPASQELMEQPDGASQVSLILPDASGWAQAKQIASARLEGHGSPLEVLSWQESMPDLMSFIEMDRSSGEAILFILVLIVAMGMFNTLLMAMLERTKEFGVLLSLGLRPAQLRKLILLEGALLGALGVGGGWVLGVALTWPMYKYGVDFSEMMGQSMEMAGVVGSTIIHSEYNWPRMAMFSVAGFVVTLISALWPAWRVGKLQPVQALRHH